MAMHGVSARSAGLQTEWSDWAATGLVPHVHAKVRALSLMPLVGELANHDLKSLPFAAEQLYVASKYHWPCGKRSLLVG
jgi:hypothetical protein